MPLFDHIVFSVPLLQFYFVPVGSGEVMKETRKERKKKETNKQREKEKTKKQRKEGRTEGERAESRLFNVV